MRSQFTSIDEYIQQQDEHVQGILQDVRQTIRAAAPDALEAISYQIPTFKYFGNLVHFAAFKQHIGFYPGAAGIEQFKDKLSAYKTSKGAVQFPLNAPVPHNLITEIVLYRLQQNTGKKKKA